ncbi:MAG TPA: M1 family aminopeptidase [Terriglobales bacterium]|nr:M1 family aminopeptidase [Terriglobales bacterium]
MIRAWFIALLAISTNAFAAAPEGIPLALAQQRAARISDIHYQLQFTLVPKAATTAGHEELRFTLKSAGEPLLLDYREGTASKLTINGAEAPIDSDSGHILLPADKLRAGENTVSVDFASPVAPAGKAITRFEDKDDGTEYLYTLFVPMDADMAFPCFDQPDLKGRFQLGITAPDDWTVISNTNGATVEAGRQRITNFAETEPISTYLFAFAAGHFKKVHDVPGMPGVYVRQSKLQQAETEAPEVQEIAKQGIDSLSAFFAQKFPFPKYDMVLIPGFAYGGMEHAGATFLREESVLFRTAPTHTDRLGRDILVLHELTHQWFGDFTTMRWFDDLWLKEGFAQFMAYHTLAELKPNEAVWKRFYESIKPAAYAIDSTKGTTPIYQDIPNLKDAKSAYGAIVYNKAPGVIKQLDFVLGDQKFRDGLRLYLQQHAYGNAQWSDLVHAWEQASGQDLEKWAEMWVRHRGMPQVEVQWSCAQGKLARLTLSQHDVLNEGGVWPIATEVLLQGAQPERIRAEFDAAASQVRAAVGKPCPRYVWANDRDEAYGRFLLDRRSRPVVMQDLGGVHDVFLRALLWGSLWDSVREADLAPRDFVALSQKLLPTENDESLTQSIIGHDVTALHRFMPDAARQSLVPPLEKLAADRMLHAPEQGLRIIWFRGLRGLAETADGRGDLKKLLSGEISVPGVQLRPLDRWSMVTTLIAGNDPDASAVFAAEQNRDHSGDGLKYAWIAQAARPDAAAKKQYFDEYLHNAQRPEDWIEQSLSAFNFWNQSELTAPYLKPALDALPQIKQNRKIFFLVAWLNAFIDGQHSPQADQEVYSFLKTNRLDKDLQLKILQAVDELDRAVKIRAKYQ